MEKVKIFILSLFDVFYLLFDGFRSDFAVFSGMFIFRIFLFLLKSALFYYFPPYSEGV